MSEQSIHFEYKLDEAEFAALTHKLRELAGNRAKNYIARALNKTAVTGRKKIRLKVQATHTVKAGGFNREVIVQKASGGSLTAYIKATGKPIGIPKFHWAPNRNSKAGTPAAKVDVVKEGLKEITGYGNKAFVGGGHANGQVYVRTDRPAKRYKGREAGQYRSKRGRKTPASRRALDIKKGPSVPGMIRGNLVWPPLRTEIGSDLKKYMEQQIAQLVGGG